MRKILRFSILSLSLLALPQIGAAASGPVCRDTARSLKTLENSRDPELRSSVGTCLVRNQLDRPEVARAVLKILRNASEDVLLREDLVAAFGETPLRRQIRVEGKLAPEMGAQEKVAVERTLASAHGLLALTGAVKSMQETVPLCPLEKELFHALSDIAMDDSSHVLLRAAAVEAMEKASKRVSESGVYDEKELRLVHETLRAVASREDNASYFSGAALAYGRLTDAGLPGFPKASVPPTRMLSSVKSVPAK